MSARDVSTQEKPLVVVLTSTYPRWRGDPEPGFVHELARRLVGRFRVVVIGPHAAGAAPRETLDGVDVIRYRYAPAAFETLVNDGGIVTNLRRSRWKVLLLPAFVISQWLALRRVLRSGEIGAVHAHWFIPQGIVAAWMAQSRRMPPFLVTSHGSDLLALKGRLADALRRIVLKRASAIAVVSGAMKERLRDYPAADPDRIYVAPMGVDLSARFTPDPATQRNAHEILFVGRLVAGKGLEVLLDAMRVVVLTVPSAVLRIAGFGPLAPWLHEAITAQGLAAHVTCAGAIDNAKLPEFYRRAAVFVAPFTIEQGFGLTLIEAAGCGCRVVASDVPSCREIVGSIGTGTIVPIGDRAALASALVAALRAPAVSPGGTCERLMQHDWTAVASRYAELLDRCIEQGKARRQALS
jgi:glycosyltransferase involved in cell wall biosynthesis